MNTAEIVARELSLPLAGVNATLELLAGGATVPFISRYRKEATGGLDDEAISKIAAHLEVVETRESRRATILGSLREQGVLTPELERAVTNASTVSALEDLYLPYRPKRRTRAMTARERGLQPLADVLWAQGSATGSRDALAAQYVSADVPDVEAVWAGARDIVAETISERSDVRAGVRQLFVDQAELVVDAARGKSKDPELAKFADHVGRRERASQAPSHRVLAAERGETEGLLKVGLELDGAVVRSRVSQAVLKRGAAPVLASEMNLAVGDAIDRLLLPSLESERRRAIKEKADEEAIAVFARNLTALLLAAPLGGKPVLAIDPGLRTGCKIAVLDARGDVLAHSTIYPHTGREAEAGAELAKLLKKYAPSAIAIGNGTAGRETEAFVRKVLSSGLAAAVRIVSVSEAGASVYSASEVAREELPALDVTIRGAVSIGRRLQDPLAELVKIDPKSIGVGQYQHDVDQPSLNASLDRVVEAVVNKVGVDLNTASPTLLRYVSGLGPALAKAIVDYRAKNGAFESRSKLKDVPRLGARAFEQCAGFLRISDGSEPLDASAVHPERYALVTKIAKDLGVTRKSLVGNDAAASKIDVKKYVDADVGLPTLNDIVAELKKPGRDPRAEFVDVGFDPNITEIDHIKPGQVLNGIVTNVAAFGAFVDLGVHQDGLVHVSELSNHFVKDPSEIVKVGDRVKVKVLQVDLPRKRIGLSMKALQAPSAAPPQNQARFNNAPRFR